MESYVIGIDVGTGSVRGALVNKSGKILKMCTEDITTWNPSTDFYHQSSTEIWSSCCSVIKVRKLPQLTILENPFNE